MDALFPPPFTEEENKVQTGTVTYPRSHHQTHARARSKPGILGPEAPLSTPNRSALLPDYDRCEQWPHGAGAGAEQASVPGLICLEPGEAVFKCFLLPNS